MPRRKKGAKIAAELSGAEKASELAGQNVGSSKPIAIVHRG